MQMYAVAHLKGMHKVFGFVLDDASSKHGWA
jgi:hypothetical protein